MNSKKLSISALFFVACLATTNAGANGNHERNSHGHDDDHTTTTTTVDNSLTSKPTLIATPTAIAGADLDASLTNISGSRATSGSKATSGSESLSLSKVGDIDAASRASAINGSNKQTVEVPVKQDNKQVASQRTTVGDNTQRTTVGDNTQRTTVGDNTQKTTVGDNTQRTTVGDNTQKTTVGDTTQTTRTSADGNKTLVGGQKTSYNHQTKIGHMTGAPNLGSQNVMGECKDGWGVTLGGGHPFYGSGGVGAQVVNKDDECLKDKRAHEKEIKGMVIEHNEIINENTLSSNELIKQMEVTSNENVARIEGATKIANTGVKAQCNQAASNKSASQACENNTSQAMGFLFPSAPVNRR